MFKQAITALVFSGVFASAHADVLLQQNFDNVAGLTAAGWVMNNASTPGPGLTGSWYQGVSSVFAAHDGAANSYIAANYNAAPAGGFINNWLITPEFSTTGPVTVSFWLRGAFDPGYTDTVAFGFSQGGTLLSDFTMSASFAVPTNDWTLYTLTLAGGGAGSTGRFAIQYSGAADSMNYIGVDTLTVRTADVPEPATVLILASGLLGMAAARRRRPRA